MGNGLRFTSVVLLSAFVAVGCSEPATSHGEDPISPLFSLSSGDPITIAGFDIGRGGAFSLANGNYFAAARQAVLAVNSAVSFVGLGELSSPSLSNVEILAIASSVNNGTVISPLSPSEQDALLGFVRDGGCALLFSDNSTLGGVPQTLIAHQSLLDPFGLKTDGLMGGPVDAPVPNPGASPVTDGPFGVVTVFAQSWPGGFYDLGNYAYPLASNPLGYALAVIDPGAIVVGSGPVVIFSDVTGFADVTYNSAGRSPENETLWLNSLDYCLTPASPDERIESVKEDVEALVSEGGLDRGDGGSLTVKLSAAQKKLSQGSETATINMLGAFINQVKALVSSGRLEPEEGQGLIGAAQAVIDQLSQ